MKTLSQKNNPHVQAFFDQTTNTISYVVSDVETKQCAVIDSVMDYEPYGATISFESAQKIVDHIKSNDYILEWILETHVHADHISAAKYIQEKCGGKIGISNHITEVQNVFGDVFSDDEVLLRDGSQFDVLFNDDETFMIGSINAQALYVPGHTPADVAYYIGDVLFVGDTMFMPDYGSARCDFPGGSPEKLYDSVFKLFALPEMTRVFVCHDYLPEGRKEYIFETTLGDEKTNNIHLRNSVLKEDFIALRSARDATLGMPKLIIPAIQVNIRGGVVPKNSGGKMKLIIPINSIFSKKVYS